MKRINRLIVLCASASLAGALSPRVAGEDFGVTTAQGTGLELTNKPTAMRVTLLADGSLHSISAYIGGVDEKDIRVAIYADNSGSVGALLAESPTKESETNAMYWETFSMPSVPLTAGNYWLAICFDDADLRIQYVPSGGTGSTGNTLNAVENGYDDPWDENTTNNYVLSIYATTGASGTFTTAFISVEEEITLSDTAGIGTYGTDPLVVATNSKDDHDISLSGSSTIQGDVYVGVNGDENDVIDISGSASITGTTDVLSSAVTIPDPSEPSVGGSPATHTYSAGITTINSDIHASDLTLNATAIIQIVGTVVILVEDTFTMDDDARIQLSDGASLSIYVKKEIDIKGNAAINTINADPSDLILVKLDDKKHFLIEGNARVYANLISHDEKLAMSNNAKLYGSFEGKKLKLENNAWIYGSEPGASVTSTTPRLSQWQEIDPN